MRKIISLDNYQFNEIDGDIISLYYSHGHDGIKDMYNRDLDISSVMSLKTKDIIKKYFDYQMNNSAVDLMGAFICSCEKLIPLFNTYYQKEIDIMELEYEEYCSIINDWWILNYKTKPSNYYISFISSFYSFSDALKRIGKDEIDFDEWILERLGIPIRCKKTKGRTFISFKRIPLKYRQLVKDYIYDRLLVDSVTTCDVRLTVLTDFTKYLEAEYPDLNIYNFEHDMFFNYFKMIDKSSYSQCTKKKYVDNLKYFIDYCQCNDIINGEEIIYLKNHHISILQNHDPNPLSKEELQAISFIKDYLPERHKDMLQLEIEMGMRPIDLSSLEIDDLVYIDGNPFLSYMMYKVRRENMIPLSKLQEDILKRNINYSKNKYGDKAKYIFQVKDKPFNFTAVVYRVNSLLDKYGFKFKIHAYRFRYNFATRMAMNNVPAKVITDFLGQADFQNLPSYYQPKDQEIIPFVNEHLKNIDSLLRISKGEKPISHEPLIIMNGFCNRSVKSECSKGNACLTCSFYVPKSKNLVKNQLEYELELINNKKNYAINVGFKDIVKYYDSLEKAVINRLSSLERMGD